MSSPSNLYAEKVFGDQPMALWALDEQCDYLSLLVDADRYLENGAKWTVSGTGVTSTLTAFDFSNPTTVPITASHSSKAVLSGGTVATFTSSATNTVYSDISVGFYLYALDSNITKVRIGYKTTANPTPNFTTTTITGNLNVPTPLKWNFFSETFAISSTTAGFAIVIEVTYSGASTSFVMNGLTMGHWTEEFNANSLGVSYTTLPTNINATNITNVLQASSYGANLYPAYYTVLNNNKQIAARNSSIPMVYGATNTTIIVPNTSGGGSPVPSIIFPGFGFMNESGKYKDRTFEAWLRINPNNTSLRRIFGPIDTSNTDGLYTKGPFLILKIGDTYGSHFVGEWQRPMLLDISIGENSASLFINAEEVISLSFDSASKTFASKYVSSKDNDYVGFYCYSDVPTIEIDCVAIYPYRAESDMLKRRFAWGQAVDFPEAINSAYGGTSIFVDFPLANYANTYSYPKLGKWSDGIINNISTVNNTLATPQYSLPTFISDKYDYATWKADFNATLNGSANPYIQLNPTSVASGSGRNWSGGKSYFVFEDLNIIADKISNIWGEFTRYPGGIGSDQILFKIENIVNGDYFKVIVNNSTVSYKFKYGTQSEQTVATATVTDAKFNVGIDLNIMATRSYVGISSFFASSSLKLYIGGDGVGNTFTGNLYRFGLSSKSNIDNRPQNIMGANPFDQTTGIVVDILPLNSGLSYMTGSYTLIATSAFGTTFLDIATSSTWKSYIPLSYFAKNIVDNSGNVSKDLDAIQVNVNYPELNSFSGSNYDQTYASAKTYLSFEKTSTVLTQSTYTTTNAMPANGYIASSTFSSGTRYEIVDGAVIYTPTNVDLSQLSLVTYVELISNSSILEPINIRSIEYAGIALNNTSSTNSQFDSKVANPIGTKFGTNIYPYTLSGTTFDYKADNPIRIYKNRNPHLYMSGKTGIQLVGAYNSGVNRGILIPVNERAASGFNIGSLQIALRYNFAFPTTEMKIFEISSASGVIEIYLKSNSSDNSRGQIYAKSNGSVYGNIAYFWNGDAVKFPTLTKNEWGLLGMSFTSLLSFEAQAGSIRITAPILINNLSFYQVDSKQVSQRVVTRGWDVIQSGHNWTYWNDGIANNGIGDSVWSDILVTSANQIYGINPNTIYNIFTGINKTIINSDSVTSGSQNAVVMSLQNYRYSVFNNIKLETNSYKPL